VVLFPRAKSPEHEAEISSQYSAAMRNESSYTSTPPYALILVHRDVYLHIVLKEKKLG
jgi:hypothetical protein